MFELSKSELNDSRCQIGTSRWGGTRYSPFAFTEQGVAMLSSYLNSDRAIQVNIQIMRIFSQLGRMLEIHKDLKRKIEEMEKKYDENFQVVFEAIKQLFDEEVKPRKKIGYIKEKKAHYGKRSINAQNK
jgi:ORF6N domain